jgi:hypothetical protein
MSDLELPDGAVGVLTIYAEAEVIPGDPKDPDEEPSASGSASRT